MLDVHVGDEVIFKGSIETKRVTVTRVGRTLFDVKINGRNWSFRLEDGVTNDGHNGSPPRILTLDQYAAEERYAEAKKILQEAGLSPQRKIDHDLVEKLARVICEHQEGG